MDHLLRLKERVEIAIELGESYYREFKSGYEGPPKKSLYPGIQTLKAIICSMVASTPKTQSFFTGETPQ